MQQAQLDNFQSRLNRIATSKENTFATVYVGPQDVAANNGKAPKGVQHAKARARNTYFRDRLRQMFRPVVALFAFLVAVAAVVAARMVRYKLFGLSDLAGDPRLDMAVDAAIGIALLLALHLVLKLRTYAHGLAKVMGLIAGLGLMHNAVHAAPDVFTGLFSPEWVSGVLATTEPATLMLAGTSYTF